jgi:hypothetical protein
LHAELGAPGFHLLLSGRAGPWPSSAGAELVTRHPGLLTMHRIGRDDGDGVLVDHTGRAHHLLGIDSAGTHLLIRPDGHLAHRGDADLSGVRAYLHRWLRDA